MHAVGRWVTGLVSGPGHRRRSDRCHVDGRRAPAADEYPDRRHSRRSPCWECRYAGGSKPGAASFACPVIAPGVHVDRRTRQSAAAEDDCPNGGKSGRCPRCRDRTVMQHGAMADDPGKLAEPAGILKTSGARGPGAGSSLLPSRGTSWTGPTLRDATCSRFSRCGRTHEQGNFSRRRGWAGRHPG
jgi:hypothetical protein